MNTLGQLLALLSPGTPNATGGFLESLRGPLLIVAIALGLALIIAMVIFAMHRDGTGRQSKRRQGTRLSASKPVAPGEEGTRRKKRRRHKRRRRDHRKRNPTLSETGGLPPKDNDPPEAEEEKPDQ
ncbi:MAG: hypothetical protein H8E20_00895 [Verrucomicrobia bacterium]|nr:hypothetical protein [Verrucomicrobiota bacterium]